MMRSILATLLMLSLAACDDLAIEEPDAESDASSVPDAAAWPTARDAARAYCSPLCRWHATCKDEDATACRDSCLQELCQGVDCERPPSGDERTLDTCVRAMHLEASHAYTCNDERPFALTEACIAAVRPASEPGDAPPPTLEDM